MYRLFCDSSVYPNPGGLAAFGFVLFRDEQVIEKGYGAIGNHPGTDSLKAEYVALSQGLLALVKHISEKNATADIFCDFKFIVDQLTGVCRKKPKFCPEKQLLDFHIAYLRDMKVTLNFKWVPREHNKIADALAKTFRSPVPTSDENECLIQIPKIH